MLRVECLSAQVFRGCYKLISKAHSVFAQESALSITVCSLVNSMGTIYTYHKQQLYK